MLPVLHSFHPVKFTLRLTPLVAALTLAMSPLTGQASPLSTVNTSIAASADVNANSQTFRFHQDHVLGTSLDIVVTANNAADAEQAVQAIGQEIARLDQVLSVWRTDSEISSLNRDHQIKASPDLLAVIAACESWRSTTCGAFDARLGQLIGAWEQTNGVHTLDDATRHHLLKQLNQSSIQLDASTGQIQTNAAVQLAPDGYAKGYIIDRAVAAAREAVPSVQGLLVDIGGDLRVWGQASRQSGWQVGVRDAQARADNAVPSQILNLNNQAVAFSGQGARVLAGQSHVLNPATGLPVNQVEQCVVVGTCAADADALAKALTALPPTQGMQLIEQLLGYEAQLTTSDGTVFQSNGWQNLLSTQLSTQQPAQMLNTASDAKSSWPAGYQAKLELNIPKLDVENYRAPYVSVWVTDSDKKLVRTLAAWGKDPKWIDSNYVWWRRYGRQLDNIDAVAKPSRQPGQYSLAWDGKDDKGQSVGAGKYIVHVEFSREHGDHTYQSFELNAAPQAATQTLPAKAEAGALKLSFQRSI